MTDTHDILEEQHTITVKLMDIMASAETLSPHSVDMEHLKETCSDAIDLITALSRPVVVKPLVWEKISSISVADRVLSGLFRYSIYKPNQDI